VRKIETGEEIALSSDETEENAYSERLWWSHDSEKIATVQIRKGEDRKIHLIESSPKDQLQPKLHTLSYTKPGDRIDIAKPQLFNVVRERHILISNELCSVSLQDALRRSPPKGVLRTADSRLSYFLSVI